MDTTSALYHPTSKQTSVSQDIAASCPGIGGGAAAWSSEETPAGTGPLAAGVVTQDGTEDQGGYELLLILKVIQFLLIFSRYNRCRNIEKFQDWGSMRVSQSYKGALVPDWRTLTEPQSYYLAALGGFTTVRLSTYNRVYSKKIKC